MCLPHCVSLNRPLKLGSLGFPMHTYLHAVIVGEASQLMGPLGQDAWDRVWGSSSAFSPPRELVQGHPVGMR